MSSDNSAPIPSLPPPVAHAAAAKACLPARVSLALAVIGAFPPLFFLGLPAVICGHVARARIRKAKGALKGLSVAGLGLVFGYVEVAIGTFLLVVMVSSGASNPNSVDKQVLKNARCLAAAADQYYLENGVKSCVLADIVGPTKYVAPLTIVAGEKYPERFTQGVTITITGIEGARTITYAP